MRIEKRRWPAVVLCAVLCLSGASIARGEQTISAAGLTLELPEGWRAETPSSSMRAAQVVVPGDAGDAEMTLFFFGAGGGGSVDANIDRWIGQIQAEPGSEPRRETLEANGLRITLVDVSGTLQPSRMGTGPSQPVPDSRLLGAVVEGPGGPWFLKVIGPQATLASQRDAFVRMLEALQAS